MCRGRRKLVRCVGHEERKYRKEGHSELLGAIDVEASLQRTTLGVPPAAVPSCLLSKQRNTL